MTPEMRSLQTRLAFLAFGVLVITAFVVFVWRPPTPAAPTAEDEQPTHRVRVWCPDRKGHIDLRLPGFAQSVVIDVAAACGSPNNKAVSR